MNPTELKLDSILEGRDENLEEIKDESGDSTTNLDNTTGADDNTSGDDGADNGSADSATDGTDTADDGGFTANDLEQEVEETTTNEPAPQKNLNPETQYIADNLPEITTRIVQDGKIQEVSIKSWTQLPPDVEFASKRDELAFINAITAQENRARELQSEFRTNQNQQQATEFEQRENAMIRDDISELQSQKVIPMFKTKPGDKGFEEDPGYKAAQEVLEFMNNKNQEYLEGFNKQGKAYRHIGFAEAYYMMPKTQQRQVQQEAQRQEDTQRHQKARNVAGNENNSNPNIRKATVRQGTSLDDIVNRIEQTW